VPQEFQSTTLQALHERGERVFAHHAQLNPRICVHYSMLSVPRLIELLGPDFDLGRHLRLFCSWLRCSRCGNKGNVSLTFTPADRRPLSEVRGDSTWGGWRPPGGPVPIVQKRRRRR
jgi:hypothetical protein